jgi:hypothetical protein
MSMGGSSGKSGRSSGKSGRSLGKSIESLGRSMGFLGRSMGVWGNPGSSKAETADAAKAIIRRATSRRDKSFFIAITFLFQYEVCPAMKSVSRRVSPNN